MLNLDEILNKIAHLGAHTPGIVTAAYIAAAVLFILCLGGLSGQESAKRAVWYGIAGMALAVVAAFFTPGVGHHWLIVLMLLAGAGAGYVVAKRVQMTEMPQLVAALHSFVGLAAVLIGFNTHIELSGVMDLLGGLALNPIRSMELILSDPSEMSRAIDASLSSGFVQTLIQKSPAEIGILMVETFVGVFIGAVTFTGSIVAFGKLAGKVDGKASKLKGGHYLNAGAALLSLVLLVVYLNTGSFWALGLMTLAALFIGYHLVMGIGGADMPVVVSMLNSY
jgi:NAD(P) transhydrogenase subunit beta